MGTNGKTPEDVYHYRKAICCKHCPAFEPGPEAITSCEEDETDGFCKRHKMPVKSTNTCDKDPAWKTVHVGHKEGK